MAILNGENNALANPQGVDVAVQKIQNQLFSRLDWRDVQLFGRVSKVPNPEEKTGFKPYAFRSGKDYQNVTRDDRFNAQVFFVLADRQPTTGGILYKVECKIVFMINVAKLFPGSSDRADARAQSEAVKALTGQQTFAITSLGTGLKECLGEFDTEDLKFVDMQPNHVFCITGQLQYNISC